MRESLSPTRSAVPLEIPSSATSRDQLFLQLALSSGLVDEETLRHAASQRGMSPELPLAEFLVQSGLLSEKARQGIEVLLEEHLSKQGSNPQASISSVASFPTASFIPAVGQKDDSPTLTLRPANGDASPFTKRFGHYELIEEIARGGMGVVYQARQTKLNRLVALKMIRSAGFASQEDVKRFYAEAEAAAGLDHPGIVPVYEVGEIEGQHFFSMAFVPGQSLSSRVKADGPLPPKLAAQLLKTIAEAVQYAHEKGIVHRDIKPHNILLDENEQPRVADFGLAKQVQGASDLTTTGQVMGTPSYMPPEQAAGNTAEVGPAADVYSLGATLYCLLTGRPPFQASSMAETIRQVLDQQPVPLRTLNPEIPRDLETICLKCLRKEPGNRYASAQELASDLSRFIAGEPIHARPVGAVERGWKWVQRRPITAALGVVSVLGLFATAIASVSLNYQSRLATLNSSLEEKNTELDSAEKIASKARDDANKQRDAANEAKKLLAQHRYASDMAMAGRAWREGNIGRMLELLNRHVPKEKEEDLRGFEWYYLRGQERHDLWRAEETLVRLSPSGKYLAMRTDSGIRLLNPRTREPNREIPVKTLNYGDFAFSGDSARMIVPVAEHEVAVWDVENKTEVNRLRADDLLVSYAGLNKNGSLAVTVGTGTDHSFRLWDVASGKEMQKWGKRGGYYSFGDFSPDGKQLAFLDGSTLIVHDLVEKKTLFTVPNLAFSIINLHYHPTEPWLMMASGEDSISFYDRTTGSPIKPPISTKGLRGNSLSISPDGKRILTGVAADNSIRLWDGETGAELCVRKGHLQKPVHVALHPEGMLALSQAIDGGVRLWEMQGGQESRDLAGPFSGIREIAFSPDKSSPLLAYLEANRRLVVTDGKEHRAITDQNAQIYHYAFSPDGKQVFALDYRGTADFWDVATGQRLQTLQEPTGAAVEVAFNHVGNMVATVSMDKKIRVWESKSGKLLHQFPFPMTNNGILKVYFQPQTDDLVSAQSFDGYQIFHLSEPPQIQSIDSPCKTYQLTFSPDGKSVATAGGGPFGVSVYSFPGFVPTQVLLGHTDSVMQVRFSPDGRRLATIATDNTIRIWCMATSQELLTLPTPPPGYHLAFSVDGRRIAAAGMGNTLMMWDSGPGYGAEKPPRK